MSRAKPEAQIAFSPNQVAQRLGIGRGKVLAWIRSGQLLAMNLTEGRTVRPRYRIYQEALDDFLRSRTTRPKQRIERRRDVKHEDVIEYI